MGFLTSNEVEEHRRVYREPFIAWPQQSAGQLKHHRAVPIHLSLNRGLTSLLGREVRLKKCKHVLFPLSNIKVEKVVPLALRVPECGIDLSHMGF